MSLTTAAGQPVGRRGGRSPALPRLGGGSLFGAGFADACLAAALPVLWMLGHGFVGIEGDGRIYMGRVLADLDPAGVGRDLMFALDGQSAFTLFSPLASGLARGLGLGPTVLVLTLVGVAAWFAGALALARAVAPGRATLLVVAALCLLPRAYGPYNLLSAGEALAVPRPLAEAGVLFALPAMARGRLALALPPLAAAALFHPIMAAPGIGVLLVLLCRRDPRRLAVLAGLAAVLLAAGLAGLPFLARLTARVDPDWLMLLRERNPYLFLRLWPGEPVGAAIVQAVTILVGTRALPPAPRAVFTAALAVGLCGCVASYVGCDIIGSQLLLQAQPWRALWLPAALAPLAAGLCLRDLPARGPAGLIALAALGLAWIAFDAMPIAPLAAFAGAAALWGIPRLLPSLGRPAVIAAVAACLLLAVVIVLPALTVLRAVLAGAPPDAAVVWKNVWLLRLPVLPVMAASYALWRWPRHPVSRLGAPALVAVGVAVLAIGWDTRSAAKADADAGHVAPDLAALLSPRPGAVLWSDGDEGWYWARRANWIGQTQGGGLVFSRALAMAWRERTEATIAAGLQGRWVLRPWVEAGGEAAPEPHLDAARIAAFCRRADAPGSIVVPLRAGEEPPAALRAAIWRPRPVLSKLRVGPDGAQWQPLDRYAVIPCAAAPADGTGAAPSR